MPKWFQDCLHHLFDLEPLQPQDSDNESISDEERRRSGGVYDLGCEALEDEQFVRDPSVKGLASLQL